MTPLHTAQVCAPGSGAASSAVQHGPEAPMAPAGGAHCWLHRRCGCRGELLHIKRCATACIHRCSSKHEHVIHKRQLSVFIGQHGQNRKPSAAGMPDSFSGDMHQLFSAHAGVCGDGGSPLALQRNEGGGAAHVPGRGPAGRAEQPGAMMIGWPTYARASAMGLRGAQSAGRDQAGSRSNITEA